MAFGDSYANAIQLSESDIVSAFESDAFTNIGKKQEAEYKLQLAIINRLDAVIKSNGNLANVIAKRS